MIVLFAAIQTKIKIMKRPPPSSMYTANKARRTMLWSCVSLLVIVAVSIISLIKCGQILGFMSKKGSLVYSQQQKVAHGSVLVVPISTRNVSSFKKDQENNSIQHDSDNASERKTFSSIRCSNHQCSITNACVEREVVTKRRGSKFVVSLWDVNLTDLTPFLGGRDNAITEFRVSNATQPEMFSNNSAAITNRFVPHNCGHQLGDVVMPIFRLLRVFGAEATPLSDLYLNSRQRSTECDHLLQPLFSNKLYTMKGMRERQCYNKLYIGTCGVSFMAEPDCTPSRRLDTMNEDFLAFREHIYRFAEVSVPPIPDTIIVMRKKKGKNMANFHNLNDMVTFLRTTFPDYKTQVVSWSDYAGLSLTEPLTILSRAKVMISLPGADILNGIFMPTGSSLIVYCRPRIQKELDAAQNDIDNWFQYLTYVNTSVEECNSGNVIYNFTSQTTEVVNFESFRQRLLDVGLMERGGPSKP